MDSENLKIKIDLSEEEELEKEGNNQGKEQKTKLSKKK